ncbi:MAG: acetolactate decarboxylase [Thermoguttaceae bacterium]|nr:acetolactate decarboxylase [Thermoguttaceae bacterium]
MKFKVPLVLTVLLALWFTVSAKAISPDGRELVQISTTDALLSGEYDGVATIRDLIRFGNFGIGTVDAIDGELILYQGVPYVAKSDGRVTIATNAETVPFATVYRIDRGHLTSVRFEEPINRDEFTRIVDRLAPDPNIFYAVLFEGEFVSVGARSEKRQEKPYRPLADVMKTDEVRFSYADQTGVLVGFRSPKLVGSLNVPGDHLHFLSSDRSVGGHAVDFVLRTGRISVQPIPVFKMYLPVNLDVNTDRPEENRVEELLRIER